MDEVFQFLSSLEQKVYSWLVERDIPFRTQVKMFGYREIGSATIDFIIPDRNLAWRCMGAYWHSSFEAKARDELGKENLVNAGYIVVDLYEEDLSDEQIDHTLELALQGMEVPR